MATASQIRKVFHDTSESLYDSSGVNQALGELLWHSAFAMGKEDKFSVSVLKERGRVSVNKKMNKFIFSGKKESLFKRKLIIQTDDLLSDVIILFRDDLFAIDIVYSFADINAVSYVHTTKYTLPYDVSAIPIISDLFIRFLVKA